MKLLIFLIAAFAVILPQVLAKDYATTTTKRITTTTRRTTSSTHKTTSSSTKKSTSSSTSTKKSTSTATTSTRPGTTTKPYGGNPAPPPTSTVYTGPTVTLISTIPCAGSSLVTAAPISYPSSSYTTTVTSGFSYFTNYQCCLETFLRSTLENAPPTSTTYLTTVTSTAGIVCGGCEPVLAFQFPYQPTYTATVTVATTTSTVLSCSARSTVVNTATYSTCTTPPAQPTDNGLGDCLSSNKGLSGCPYVCGRPVFMAQRRYCFDRDVSQDMLPGSFPVNYSCQRCLPACPGTGSE